MSLRQAQGKPNKPIFTYKDMVRYSDCDMHQHLNHAVYFSFFEQARVAFWEKLGMLKSTADFHSIPLIIAAAHCDYKAPAYLNQEVEIQISVTHIGTKSFRFDYEMKDAQKGALLATGYTIQVMFDYEKGESVAIPENLKQLFSSFCR